MITDDNKLDICKILSVYKDNPFKFAQTILNAKLIWEGQRKILESVKTYPITVVPSGHATGKSSSAAFITLWWICTRFKSRVIVTAPTWRQLQTIFYAELNKWYNKSKIKNFDLLLMKQNIMQINIEEYMKEWYMLPISPRNPDALQGQHGDKSLVVEEIMDELGIAKIESDDEIQQVIELMKGTKGEKREDNILVIVDEASGVDDRIPEVLEGTDPTRMVIFGNMTKTSGFFYEWAYHMVDEDVNVITLSSYDSPFMSQKQIESMERRYGKDSDVIDVRLRGLPPSGNANSCIPRSLIEECKNIDNLFKMEDIEVLGVDPARYGGDYTVGYSTTGGAPKLEFYFNKQSTMECIGEIVRWCRRTPKKKHYLGLDATGLGGPIADRIYEILDEDYTNRDIEDYVPFLPNFELIEIHNNGVPRDEMEYGNKITEMFFILKERLINKQIKIPNDDELIQDLTTREYHFDSKGRLVVEKKDDFKKRIGRSPGKGDALLLCIYTMDYVISW